MVKRLEPNACEETRSENWKNDSLNLDRSMRNDYKAFYSRIKFLKATVLLSAYSMQRSNGFLCFLASPSICSLNPAELSLTDESMHFLFSVTRSDFVNK